MSTLSTELPDFIFLRTGMPRQLGCLSLLQDPDWRTRLGDYGD